MQKKKKNRGDGSSVEDLELSKRHNETGDATRWCGYTLYIKLKLLTVIR